MDHEFEGFPVLSMTIAVTQAGDGLSKAMSVRPDEMHLGDTVQVLLECEVSKIRYEQVKDTDGVSRVHVLKAGRATIVEGKPFDKALDDMSKKLEAVAGIQRLPLDEDDD